MPVYRYLDLSTAHLTEVEATEVCGGWGFGGLDRSPRVIPHEYGAWVNVPVLDGTSWSVKDAIALAADRPNLAACLAKAREYYCNWINFDADAETDATLPTYEW